MICALYFLAGFASACLVGVVVALKRPKLPDPNSGTYKFDPHAYEIFLHGRLSLRILSPAEIQISAVQGLAHVRFSRDGVIFRPDALWTGLPPTSPG